MLKTNEAPLILSVCTATEERSVAVARGKRLLASEATEVRSPNASAILYEIDSALSRASVNIRDIELFAVAVGPGSFTGLRAGLATIKALAATLERRVAGVQTLHALAYAARPSERLVALMHAGRGEVFAQFLGADEDGAITEYDAPMHISLHALYERAANFSGDLKWVVPSGLALSEQVEEAVLRFGRERVSTAGERHAPSTWTISTPVKALAESVAALALDSFHSGETSGADDLRALYVRASDAELKEQCLEQG